MSDPNWLEKQWAETDPRPRGELLAALAEQATTIERLTGELTACIQKLADVRAANDDLEDRANSLSTELAMAKADIRQFMERLGPRWFLEQSWFPASVNADAARAALGPAKSEPTPKPDPARHARTALGPVK